MKNYAMCAIGRLKMLIYNILVIAHLPQNYAITLH